MTQILSVEEALYSGDTDLIEAAIAAEFEREAATDKAEQDEHAALAKKKEPIDDGLDEAAKSKSEEAPTQAAAQKGNETDPAEAEAQGKVILSRNGKHSIPYTVLEQERATRQEAERRLSEAQFKIQELTAASERNQNAINTARSRMEEQGIDVDVMFADPSTITEKQWQEMEQDYGAIAKTLRTLLAKQAEMEAAMPAPVQAQPQDDVRAQVSAAIAATPDLANWMQTDIDRFTEAQRIDAELMNDPAWKGKSFTERFARVVELTKQSFGDKAEEDKAAALAKAKAVIDSAQTQLPTSLSDLGQTPNEARNDYDRYMAMPQDKLEAEMARMSPEQLNKVFERR